MSRNEGGQAVLLLVAALPAVVVGALMVGSVARGLGARADHGSAADLAAEAELSPPGGPGVAPAAGEGQYAGPLAHR